MGRRVVAQLGACILLLGLGVSEAEAQAAGVTEPASVSRFETVDGLRFHYLDWGNESAQPLLLLHGNGQHAHFWDTFAEAVAPFFRVVALDQPGYGDSDPPRDATYDRAVFVEQLDSFVRQLGLHEFILMGHSMGGMSAFPYAALHPENVARLILVDVGPFDTTNTPPARNETTRPEWRNVYASREEAFEFYKAYALDGVPLGEAEERFRDTFYHNLKPTADGRWTGKGPGGLGRAPAVARFFDVDEQWAHWRAIRAPILVVRGADSRGFSEQRAQRMVRENANTQLVTIAGSGHNVPLWKPAEFEATVRAWLETQ